ncbi:MAG TPA: hypothetical protein H9850_00950 [Candidatus Anaerobiospirillum pullistercoris]|uniref:DNA repair protein n=1 Tax=Candidatus Anaerobiospirillum pullistercoris TaxID=2838452 RepID=A0A9D1WB67_9GAMM|nr:hypothetical protein [Candidatus Anaerobiospirillum pullistercoris]
MLVTIAVIIIVLATFMLIIYNMYSDYMARRDEDLRILYTRCRNIVSETEELLINQYQLPYSKTIVLILRNRILNALKRLKGDPNAKGIEERIAEQQRLIDEIQNHYKEDLAFRNPESDNVAVMQLRTIRRLRKIIQSELRAGTPVDVNQCQKEDRRLKLLVLKINISNLIQNVTEMRRLKQVGSCRTMITKGLEVIRRSGIKDNWLMDKSDVLTQMLHDLEKSVREKTQEEIEKVNEKSETDAELDEIFGDKKKW